MRGLRRLRLARNQIRFVPLGLQKLTNLRVLNLYSNELDYLPSDIRHMTFLSELFIGANPLDAVAYPEVGQLTGPGGLFRFPGSLLPIRKLEPLGGSLQKLVLVESGAVWGACSDGGLKAWRASGELAREWRGHERRIYGLCADQAGHVLSSSDDLSVRIWSSRVRSIGQLPAPIACAPAFSCWSFSPYSFSLSPAQWRPRTFHC
jgi:WD40 repeat protein